MMLDADEIYVSAASIWEIAIKRRLGNPFDRLLVAQALIEPLRLLTADSSLQAYSDLVTVI